MLRRIAAPRTLPTYEIQVAGQTLCLTARELCALAGELEGWFDDRRDELIDDVAAEAVFAPAPTLRN